MVLFPESIRAMGFFDGVSKDLAIGWPFESVAHLLLKFTGTRRTISRDDKSSGFPDRPSISKLL